MDQILINVLQSEDPTGIVDNIERTPEARQTLSLLAVLSPLEMTLEPHCCITTRSPII